MFQTYFDLLNFFFLLFAILSLGALAGLMSERAGIVNIAIEGQMTMGALVFAIGGMFKLPIVISFILAIIAAIAISLAHGLTTIKLKANHVISGVALNFLAGGIAPFVVRVISKGAGFVATGYKPLRFSFSGPLSIMNWYFIIAVILLTITWFIINKTNIGLRFVTAGENPSALLAAGISVKKKRWIGLIISGAFAGLAGAFFTTIISNLFRGSVYGMGFIALAVLIFGQWRVKTIALAAAIFSIFTVTAHYNLQILEWFPRNFQKTLPFIISLAALIILSKNIKVPKAIGGEE